MLSRQALPDSAKSPSYGDSAGQIFAKYSLCSGNYVNIEMEGGIVPILSELEV